MRKITSVKRSSQPSKKEKKQLKKEDSIGVKVPSHLLRMFDKKCEKLAYTKKKVIVGFINWFLKASDADADAMVRGRKLHIKRK